MLERRANVAWIGANAGIFILRGFLSGWNANVLRIFSKRDARGAVAVAQIARSCGAADRSFLWNRDRFQWF
jgi:hypothetical protein